MNMALFSYLKERMMEHPDATVGDGQECIRYDTLLERAEALGKTLTQDKYGLLCKSELHTATALMACLSAGKTAVPLSMRYGERHVGKIVEAAGLSWILTDSGAEQIAPEEKWPDDLYDTALIMYTSGTTGTPKGAMISPKNLWVNLGDIESYFSISSGDTFLISRPLYHCAVLTGELLIALIKGLNIVFYNEGFNPVRVLHTIRTCGIDVMGGTPTLFYHLCSMARDGRVPLKTVAISGECMTTAVAEKVRAAMPDTQIYNVYGLTEASPRISYLPCGQFDRHPTSVGVPLRSVRARIVDGELLVRGLSIMRGYYRQPEATTKALAGGWLHTGDMVEADSNGYLYIHGRRDDMIIRGGMNIYPQEIENAVKQDSRILDVMAWGTRDERVGQKIHIMAVAPEITENELLQICRERLPGYQLPDHAQLVSDLPKSGSGKLLRPRAREEAAYAAV